MALEPIFEKLERLCRLSVNYFEAELVDHCLVLKPSNKARSNWEKIFRSETDAEDEERDEVLAMQHTWDEEEWQW